MMDRIEALHTVKANIAKALEAAKRGDNDAVLVAVSKTYNADIIQTVIDAGQRVFGENRVQESQEKWPDLKEKTQGIELRLIGPLQSNKAADAVALFDVIETVDREKIAKELAKEMAKQDRHPKLFVQVNTGNEPQKAGIDPREAVTFVARCRDVHGLTIEGLMCIPPADENPGPHFALLDKLATECGVEKRSMGMSADYDIALQCGATSVRVGSAIFGSR